MTERYSFTVDNVIWSQDNIDGVNSTLTDTMNESYVTAEEDSPTRYLSVLDSTNEMPLDNLNITLTNPKLEVEDDGNYMTEQSLEQQDDNTDQVVVFSVEGSDELFGIQTVRDEEGNLQKYQFQFRKNEDGQLEAIPETIILVPMDEDVTQELDENLEEHVQYTSEVNVQYTSEEPDTQSMHIFVQENSQEEHILPDHVDEESMEQIQEDDVDGAVMFENQDAEEEDEDVDIKPAVLAFQSVNVKQEIQEQHVEYNIREPLEELPETFTETLQNQQISQFEPQSEDLEQHEDNLIEYHAQLQQEENSVSSDPATTAEYRENESEDIHQTLENVMNNEEYEHVEVNPDVNISQTDDNLEVQEGIDDYNNETTNDSDENDYQIVEGLHITGDMEANDIVEQPIEKHISSNILKQALKTNKEQHKIVKRDNRLYLYVVQHPEKENVESLTMDMSNLCRPKVNPRSILKSSFQAKNDIVNDIQQDERMNKRFARCKEAMQARIFHNFINKTTIPQAPVRKNRLPRKQKIKPVERMDEEIVVQEVMVSNNGFVEATGAKGVNKENLAVTDYVELTDSDDDYDPKKVNRRKKKHRHRKKIEITISDDSDIDSNDSVIELDETDDEADVQSQKEEKENTNNNNTPTKRRRGRPPKNRTGDSPDSVNVDSLPKKTRLNSDELPKKPEIPCPKCDKTFPSQNSLKTHLQHHSLQSSINKRALPEYKYKCDKCGTTFINNILLRKHMCSKLFNCPVCKKKFEDVSALSAHRRIHAKEHMVKSTSTVQVSPKKIKPVQPTNSNNTFKAPKAANFCKCKTCGKLCSSLQNLTVHMKSHKELTCARCSQKFVSQLMLDKHIRESCVKSPQRSKSMANLSKKPQLNISRHRTKSTTSPGKKSPVKTRMSMNFLKVECDKCLAKFNGYQALFKHKVQKHGAETPDKSILEKNEEVTKEHGGVPAASRLKNAYSGLRVQLDFND